MTFGLLLASALAATAQVTVEILLDQEQYLQDESIPVKVRVVNRSGQTLQLGAEADWLTFTIDGPNGTTPAKLAEPQVIEPFSLASASMATRTVNLTPCFDFSQPGRYQATATVRIKDWNENLTSRPKAIEVVRGTRLWEQDFGVPSDGEKPESRRYTLQQASYRNNLQLYVRVAEANEGRPFRVFPIGALVSFSKPEAQVDKNSNLHVLCQTGARLFGYHRINPDGVVLTRQTHEYAASRPVLKLNDAGQIIVWGGARRFSLSDIPPSDMVGTSLTNTAPTSPPVESPQPAPVGKKKKDAKKPKS